MEDRLLSIEDRCRPELETAGDADRAASARDLFGILYLVSLSVAGLVGLLAVTDLRLVRATGRWAGVSLGVQDWCVLGSEDWCQALPYPCPMKQASLGAA
jgi:hypothetical protein